MRTSFLGACFCAYLMTGCSGASTGIDKLSFATFGGTVFSKPSRASLKEIHLDNGALLGQEIIVQGDLVYLGEYASHLIIADDSARMLVLLTNVSEAGELLSKKNAQSLKVLGTIERGKKGLPFILAKALKPIALEKS